MSSKSPVSPETREFVLQRDGGCVLERYDITHRCRGHLEVHHRQLRRHGNHTADNLVTLCGGGHEFVHAHPLWSRDFGLLLKSWDSVIPLVEP